MRSRRRARLLLLLLLAAACGGDAVTPGEELAGTYRLTAVDSKALPYVYWCSVRGACEQINSGRIEIMSRGRLRDITEVQGVGSPAETADVDTAVSAYELDGSRLVIKRTRADGFPSDYADTALVENGRLQIVYTPRTLNTRLVNGGRFFYAKE